MIGRDIHYLNNGDLLSSTLNEDQDIQTNYLSILDNHIKDKVQPGDPVLDKYIKPGEEFDPFTPTDPDHVVTFGYIDSDAKAGPRGPQGDKGDKGDTGPRGYLGEEGFQGDHSNVPGPKGPKGEDGDKGPRGRDGSSVNILGEMDIADILSLTGMVHGDAYIAANTDSNASIPGEERDGYVYSENPDHWKNIGKLRGKQGDQGIQGIQGVPGPKGDDGPEGDKGIDGEKGPIGIQGEEGDEGPVGYDGPIGDQGPKGDDDIVPVMSGTIVMWNSTAIPDGWVICDGANGTPDLIDRMPLCMTDTSRFFQTHGLADSAIAEHTHTATSSSTSSSSFSGTAFPGHTHPITSISNYYDNGNSHPPGYTNVNIGDYNDRHWQALPNQPYANSGGTPAGTVSTSTATSTTVNQAGEVHTNYPLCTRIVFIMKL